MWPRVDRSFEMHPECVWRGPEHKAHYLKWLQQCPHPVYMLEQHRDIPQSRRYPWEQVLDECRAMIGREHIGSHGDWMIALALRERHVSMLGLYGVEYISGVKDGERNEQLLAFKFWCGVAAGRGVHLLIPRSNTAFSLPAEVYGPESHSTLEKYQARLEREKALETVTKDGTRTEQLRRADGTETLRKLPSIPGLGHRPMPDNWEQFA